MAVRNETILRKKRVQPVKTIVWTYLSSLFATFDRSTLPAARELVFFLPVDSVVLIVVLQATCPTRWFDTR